MLIAAHELHGVTARSSTKPKEKKCREQQPSRTEAASIQSCDTNPRLRAELTLITCFASRADRLVICRRRRLLVPPALLSASISPSSSLTAPPPSFASTATTASSSSSSSRFSARKSKPDSGAGASSREAAPASATTARLRAGVGPCAKAGLGFGLGAGLKSGGRRRAQAQEHIAGRKPGTDWSSSSGRRGGPAETTGWVGVDWETGFQRILIENVPKLI